MPEKENAREKYEGIIAQSFTKLGFIVTRMPKGHPNYDLELMKGGKKGVVQIKYFPRKKITAPMIQQFAGFVSSNEGKKYHYRYYVSFSGYANTVYKYIYQNPKFRIRLLTGTAKGKLLDYQEKVLLSADQREVEQTHIGVFTGKGGVGKTIISSHLAGALMLKGYDVALVDLDPQKNLSSLINKKAIHYRTKGSFISVYTIEEWQSPKEPQFVIYDFSPDFDSNPKEIIEKMDYLVIPYNLSPLSLGVNGSVLNKSIENIRSINPDAFLIILLNNNVPTEVISGRIDIILRVIAQKVFQPLKNQKNICFINPKELTIPFNKALYHWGLQALKGERVSFVFGSKGTVELRNEFFKLADIIVNHLM